MKKDSKASYLERELSKVISDNSMLREQNKKLQLELQTMQARLDDSEDSYKRIADAYEKCMAERSEDIERLHEARVAYEDALEEVKTLMKEYKESARKWISAIKKTGKAV